MSQTSSISTAAFLRSRVGRVCVAIQAASVPDILDRAEKALAASKFLEFRLDSLDKPANAIAPIAKFLAEHKSHRGEVVAIATCRRKAHGGSFTGSLEAELDILTKAAEAGFALLDLEIESAEEATPAQLTTLHNALDESGTALQISFHDFYKTGDLEAIFRRIEVFEPEFFKIVTTARSLTDSLKLLKWIEERSGESQIVGVAMGEPGIVSRVLSLRAGSAFTFAAAPDGVETAPGQMTAHTLKDLYRIEELDQATRIYGVAGNPVSHSLSPLMQNTAFRRERINAVYLPLKTEKLDDLLTLTRELPLSGLSVTIPFKQQVIPYLANVDPLSARLGACNTIRLGADGKLYGFNTDVAGVLRPLEKRLTLKGASVLVLGAGGAARAAVFGLADKGANVSIWSRTEAKSKTLAAEAGVKHISRNQIPATTFDVLVHATPCGMQGNSEGVPLKPEEWKANLVFDLVYNPLDTPLLQQARDRGLPTIQGVEMFVHQGARQFEIWTGKPAPEAEMLRVVLFALQKARELAGTQE